MAAVEAEAFVESLRVDARVMRQQFEHDAAVRFGLSDRPAQHDLADALPATARGDADILDQRTSRAARTDAGQKTQLKTAYADSLKIIWVFLCALSGACLISTFFVKSYTLQQEHQTLQGMQEKKVAGSESEKEVEKGL